MKDGGPPGGGRRDGAWGDSQSGWITDTTLTPLEIRRFKFASGPNLAPISHGDCQLETRFVAHSIIRGVSVVTFEYRWRKASARAPFDSRFLSRPQARRHDSSTCYRLREKG